MVARPSVEELPEFCKHPSAKHRLRYAALAEATLDNLSNKEPATASTHPPIHNKPIADHALPHGEVGTITPCEGSCVLPEQWTSLLMAAAVTTELYMSQPLSASHCLEYSLLPLVNPTSGYRSKSLSLF